MQQICLPTNDDECSSFAPIDYLPEEVLRMIFQLLPRAELLKLTTVCRRWNVLIFQLLSGRLFLRIHDKNVNADLSQDRIYRHIRIVLFRGMQALVQDHMHRFDDLGMHAESLHLELRFGHDGVILMDLLRRFPLVRSLTLFLERFHFGDWAKGMIHMLPSVECLALKNIGSCSDRFTSPRMLKQLFHKNMPSVHELSIDCQSTRVLDLLMACAPNLVSLNITVDARLLRRFCGFKFPRLQALRLTISRSIRLSTMRSFRIELFNEFMAQLNDLKTLSIDVPFENYHYFSGAIYRMASVKELTLTLKRFSRDPVFLQLNDFQPMTNLRVLRVNSIEPVYNSTLNKNAVSMPQIEELYLEQLRDGSIIPDIVTMFPRLKVFAARSCITSLTSLQRMTAAWPALEILNFYVPALTPEECKLICQLPNLRKLTLHNCRLVKEQFGWLEDVLAMSTLSELYLYGQFSDYLNWIPRINPRCRLFLNGEYINRAI